MSRLHYIPQTTGVFRVERRTLVIAVECKWADTGIDKALRYFK